MTEAKLTAVIKNPRVTANRLSEFMREYDLTLEQAELMAQHPNADASLLHDLWNEYCEDATVATAIARRADKLSPALISDIADTIVENSEAWEEQEWEGVLDAFKDTIRTNFLTQYYDLLTFTFYETLGWDNEDDDEDYDGEDDYDDDDFASGSYHYDPETDTYFDDDGNEVDYVEAACAEAWDDAMEK